MQKPTLEIVCWISALVIVSVIIVVSMVLDDQHKIDPEMRGVLGGLLVGLMARGTQGTGPKEHQ